MNITSLIRLRAPGFTSRYCRILCALVVLSTAAVPALAQEAKAILKVQGKVAAPACAFNLTEGTLNFDTLEWGKTKTLFTDLTLNCSVPASFSIKNNMLHTEHHTSRTKSPNRSGFPVVLKGSNSSPINTTTVGAYTVSGKINTNSNVNFFVATDAPLTQFTKKAGRIDLIPSQKYKLSEDKQSSIDDSGKLQNGVQAISLEVALTLFPPAQKAIPAGADFEGSVMFVLEY